MTSEWAVASKIFSSSGSVLLPSNHLCPIPVPSSYLATWFSHFYYCLPASLNCQFFLSVSLLTAGAGFSHRDFKSQSPWVSTLIFLPPEFCFLAPGFWPCVNFQSLTPVSLSLLTPDLYFSLIILFYFSPPAATEPPKKCWSKLPSTGRKPPVII